MFRCLRYLKNQTSRQLCSRNNGIVYTLSLLCMYVQLGQQQSTHFLLLVPVKDQNIFGWKSVLASSQQTTLPFPSSSLSQYMHDILQIYYVENKFCFIDPHKRRLRSFTKHSDSVPCRHSQQQGGAKMLCWNSWINVTIERKEVDGWMQKG